MALITVQNLRKRFNLEAGFFAPLGSYVHAVNGISFHIDENESYGLVGESGCGKTTTARLLVRMYEADGAETGDSTGNSGSAAANHGAIRWRGEDISVFKGKALARYREKVKYVFQDPARSLNPRMTIYDILRSGRRWSSLRLPPRQERAAAVALMEETGLSPGDLERRPAEFSGGQRQRISIARGLFMEPELLICDEIVSALDVSIQAQILNLLLDIRRRRGISFLFIAHDLRVASWFCDRIGVMYRGELVEEAPAADLYQSALHPYTRLLFASVTRELGRGKSYKTGSDSGKAPTQKLKSLYASPAANEAGTSLETGCAFAGRCPQVEKHCREEKPEFQERRSGHKVCCWL